MESPSQERDELEAEMSQTLSTLLPVSARGGVRVIRDSDADLLSPAEAAQCANVVAKVRRQRGAARYLARKLMAELGMPAADILRASSGQPLWPAGVAGSISHDESTAAVVMSLARKGLALGVDVEPACPLPADLVPLVASPAEREVFAADSSGLRMLFAIKEAVYKAVFPHDGRYLDFLDVAVDTAAGTAETNYGRQVQWRACESARIFAVAWIQTRAS